MITETIEEIRARFLTPVIVVLALMWLLLVASCVLVIAVNRPPVDGLENLFQAQFNGLLYGFGAADFFWMQVLLACSVIGLIKRKAWGWTAAMMASAIWIYFGVSFQVLALLTTSYFGSRLSILMATLAAAIIYYLWSIRGLFWQAPRPQPLRPAPVTAVRREAGPSFPKDY